VPSCIILETDNVIKWEANKAPNYVTKKRKNANPRTTFKAPGNKM